MYNSNQHLHFIGIGGVGMAGIAEVLLNLDYSISGSDLKKNALIESLECQGAKVALGHKAENIPENTSVIVYSSAVRSDNPEMLEAQARNLPCIPRAEMLAELMRMKYGVAVAGSHGKTTTTSMTAKILVDAGFDPTVIIGGRVLSQQTGAVVGTGAYLVAEADESDGSFCMLRPAIAIVSNIDSEHLGHYGTFGALEEAFRQFVSSVPFYGLVVACFDDPVVARVCSSLKRRVLSYGLSPEREVAAKDIVVYGPKTGFTLVVRGEEIGRYLLPMIGSHMVSNALAAIAVGIELGVYPDEAARALESFAGVARRSEVLFRGPAVVIDDYGHHPREISATLKAVKAAWVPEMAKERTDCLNGKLSVIFQPHRYSRTRELFGEFLGCFSEADELIVTDIYSAGEDPVAGISGQSLASAIQHPNVRYVPDLQDASSQLLSAVETGDVILTLGAGSVTQTGHLMAAELRKRYP